MAYIGPKYLQIHERKYNKTFSLMFYHERKHIKSFSLFNSCLVMFHPSNSERQLASTTDIVQKRFHNPYHTMPGKVKFYLRLSTLISNRNSSPHVLAEGGMPDPLTDCFSPKISRSWLHSLTKNPARR